MLTRLPFRARSYVTTAQQLDEGERTIFNKLTEKFSPTELQVQDVSGASYCLQSKTCIDLYVVMQEVVEHFTRLLFQVRLSRVFQQ